jgi:hypothetical protein
MIVQWSLMEQIEARCCDVAVLERTNENKNNSVQKHSTDFLMYDWFRLCYLENEIECSSVEKCWIPKTEQNLVFRFRATSKRAVISLRYHLCSLPKLIKFDQYSYNFF